MFPSSGVGKTDPQLGPLANLSHSTERDPLSETLFFLVSRIPDDGKSPKNPLILNDESFEKYSPLWQYV
jgi:hypothetical protein